MKIMYEFFFPENRVEQFELNFDDSDFTLGPLPIEEKDSWIKLEFHQCPCCPLSAETHEYCPVARNLLPVLLRFKSEYSYVDVLTKVHTENRQTHRYGALQDAVSPLIGLIMATSGCPILNKLKPMAVTHLPFANDRETIYRAALAYLFGQLIRNKHGKTPDWNMEDFQKLYATIQEINGSFFQRFRELKGKDANVNALLILNVFAQIGQFSISNNWIESISPVFEAYLRD
ncbi:MAG: hypothetical protein GF401_12230 [Chitinivibrionales bacterium]|nr:hypothetical protein [Chitinivibrionales bacterium]